MLWCPKHSRWWLYNKFKMAINPNIFEQEGTISRSKMFYIVIQCKCINRFWDLWFYAFCMYMCIDKLSVWGGIILPETNDFLEAILTNFLCLSIKSSTNVLWVMVPQVLLGSYWNSAPVLTPAFTLVLECPSFFQSMTWFPLLSNCIKSTWILELFSIEQSKNNLKKWKVIWFFHSNNVL